MYIRACVCVNASSKRFPRVTSAEQVQLTRLFRMEQGALSRGSLVPAVSDEGIIARCPPGTQRRAVDGYALSMRDLISLRFAAR